MINTAKFWIFPKPVDQAAQDIFDAQMIAFDLKLCKWQGVKDENGDPTTKNVREGFNYCHCEVYHHPDPAIGTSAYAFNGTYNKALALLVDENGDPDITQQDNYKPVANFDISTDNNSYSLEDLKGLGFFPALPQPVEG